MKKSVSLFLSVFFAFNAFLAVKAASGEELVFCAQVIPSCSERGEALPPYNSGACKGYYDNICKSQVENENLSENTNFLLKELENLKKENERLKKKLRKLKIKKNQG